jgi:hypothetical protein
MPPAPMRVRRWARSSRRDVVGQELCALRREAQGGQQARHVGGIGRRVGITPARHLVESALVLAPALEAGVPDVERLQRPPGALLDVARQPLAHRRFQDGAQQRLDLRFRDLAVAGEAAHQEGGVVGMVGIGRALGLEDAQPAPVTLVGLAFAAGRGGGAGGSVRVLHLRGRHLPRLRRPVQERVVHHRARDLLAHDGLHHAGQQALFGQALRIGVAGLDLVAQVPVAEQPLAGGEEPLPVRGEQVVGVDVVGAVVGAGLGVGLGQPRVDGGRHPRGEALGQPRLRPPAPRPGAALGQPLLERGQREVEQDHEGELVLEQVVREMGARVEGGQPLVQRELGADLQVHAAAQVASQRGEVAAHPLQGELQAAEGLVQRLAAREELRLHERPEGGRVAVLLAPVAPHLRHPALYPLRLGGMFALERGDGRGGRRVEARLRSRRRHRRQCQRSTQSPGQLREPDRHRASPPVRRESYTAAPRMIMRMAPGRPSPYFERA